MRKGIEMEESEERSGGNEGVKRKKTILKQSRLQITF